MQNTYPERTGDQRGPPGASDQKITRVKIALEFYFSGGLFNAKLLKSKIYLVHRFQALALRDWLIINCLNLFLAPKPNPDDFQNL